MKKKRRKLKKSVKRGCLLLLVVPLLLYVGTGWLVQRCTIERTDVVEADSLIADTAALTEIRQRIEHLLNTPQALDTSNIHIAVYDIASQQNVYRRHADRLAPPASCMKLLTAVAAMEYLGVHHQFVTQVKLNGEQSGSTFYGTVLLQLDDDPMVESLQPMVDALRHRGITCIEGDVVFDLLRNDTLKAHSTAATWDIPYHKLPILLKGRKRIEQDFYYLLQTAGVAFHRNPLLACPALQGIDPVAEPVVFRLGVNSLETHTRTIYLHRTPLTEILAPMLIHSSNIKADELYFHIDHVFDRIAGVNTCEGQRVQDFMPILFDALSYGSGDAVQDLSGKDYVINDGSGLSPENRLTADFLIALLRYAWTNEEMRHFLIDEALATPGHPVRHGSLLGRMYAPLYRNKIFVKTGTITTIGLSSLAGYAQAADGRWLIFAIINEDSPVAESRIFQDAFCRELIR